MNWEAIGAIGEVLGAIGVIATLAYLAIQIRQNSNVIRSSTRQAISTTQLEVGFRVAANPELRAIATRWMKGEAPSTPDEAFGENMFIRANLRAFENQYHQHNDGTFDDEVWAGYLENMKRTLSSSRVHQFWATHRALYSADFAFFVEAHLLRVNDGENAV